MGRPLRQRNYSTEVMKRTVEHACQLARERYDALGLTVNTVLIVCHAACGNCLKWKVGGH